MSKIRVEPEHREGRPAGRRLRVGLAMPGGFEFGGIGRIMLYTVRAWQASGAGPDWLLVDARGPGSLLLSPFHLVHALLLVARERWAGRLDLLHVNIAGRGSTVRKVILGLWAELWGLPTIVHLHDGGYPADLARRPAWQQRLVRRVFRRARLCLALGERDRRFLIEGLGVEPERALVLHNAVPDPGPPPERIGRPGPARLLFLGNLGDRKGVGELLAALARPALAARDWQLDLAGGGAVERFRARAHELGLAARCRFHGWLAHEATYALARDADILVLPSYSEGQAMALLEAMAHGLAILATPVGAHLEAVTDGVSALLVPPREVDAVETALVRLIDEPALRARLGRAARARWLEGFTIEGYGRRLTALYANALALPPAGSG